MAYLKPGAGAAREGRSVAGAPVAGTSEVQTLTFGGTPTGGTVTFKFKGQTSAPVTWVGDDDAGLIAAVDAALEALSTIGTGNIAAADGTLTAGVGTITLTFGGTLAKKAVPLITVVSALTGTAPTAAIAETTPGVSATHRGAPIGSSLTDTTNGKQYINTGTASVPTWTVVGAQT